MNKTKRAKTTKAKIPSRKSRYNKDECTIPSPVPHGFADKMIMNRSEREAAEIREYVQERTKGETVTLLEKLATEHVFDRKLSGWDVWTDRNRYWLVTNPMNLYSQEVFPSLDYTITFHVGLSTRMMAHEARTAAKDQRDRITIAWRKWEQATDAVGYAGEAEEFQAVGMRCRESLIAMVRAMAEDSMVPAGEEAPKASDFKRWSELIAQTIASGSSAKEIRGHLKSIALSTWQLVNWLTHATNAVRIDARMAVDATQGVLSAFGVALIRYEKGVPDRCPACSSYRVFTVYRPGLRNDGAYVSLCDSCGWTDLPMNEESDE